MKATIKIAFIIMLIFSSLVRNLRYSIYKLVISLGIIGITMLIGCGDKEANPVPKDEPFNTPSISLISELLNEPKRGLAIDIRYYGNADGFEIQRKGVGESFNTIGNLGPSTSDNHQDTYEDWDVGIKKHYVYRVCAYKDGEKSEWSSEDGRTSPSWQIGALITVPSIADAYVDEALPNKNFGDEDVLEIAYDGVQRRISYIKFQLDLIPDYANGIDFAQLIVFSWDEPVINPSTPNGFALLSDWEESSVTWNNKPTESVGGAFIIQTIYNDGTFYLFEITGTVDDWIIDGEPNYGIALRCLNSQGRSIIWSKEAYYEFLKPKLEIRYEW
ncbi:MAG: DNRLRE domain-containing protein [Bacteroidales bacterium]|nr:DNRLRE domain-containing protein [Bacteroidales bacterium]